MIKTMFNQIVKYIQFGLSSILITICTILIFVACSNNEMNEIQINPVANTNWQGVSQDGTEVNLSFKDDLSGTVVTKTLTETYTRDFKYSVESNTRVSLLFDPTTRIPYDFYLNKDGSGTYADTRLYRVQ